MGYSAKLQPIFYEVLLKLVLIQPLIHFGLSHTQNIFCGVGGVFTALYVQEVKTCRCLIQILLVTGRVTKIAVCIFLNQSSGFGVVLLLADNLFNRMIFLLSEYSSLLYISFVKHQAIIWFLYYFCENRKKDK